MKRVERYTNIKRERNSDKEESETHNFKAILTNVCVREGEILEVDIQTRKSERDGDRKRTEGER